MDRLKLFLQGDHATLHDRALKARSDQIAFIQSKEPSNDPEKVTIDRATNEARNGEISRALRTLTETAATADLTSLSTIEKLLTESIPRARRQATFNRPRCFRAPDRDRS